MSGPRRPRQVAGVPGRALDRDVALVHDSGVLYFLESWESLEARASWRPSIGGCRMGRAAWRATGSSQPARPAARGDDRVGRAARLSGDERRARDRPRGRLAPGLLRAVREQGSSASWRARRHRRARAQARARRVGAANTAGPTACTAPARRCSTTAPTSPKGARLVAGRLARRSGRRARADAARRRQLRAPARGRAAQRAGRASASRA